jgi:hypothetical protein
MQIVISVTEEDVKKSHISNFDPELHSGWNTLVRHPIAYATRRALEEVLGETNTDIGIQVWAKQLVVGNRKKKTPLQRIGFPEEVVETIRHYRATGDMKPFTFTLDIPV